MTNGNDEDQWGCQFCKVVWCIFWALVLLWVFGVVK